MPRADPKRPKAGTPLARNIAMMEHAFRLGFRAGFTTCDSLVSSGLATGPREAELEAAALRIFMDPFSKG